MRGRGILRNRTVLAAFATSSAFLGAWKVAYVPGTDRARRLRATLHKHSHLLSERVLADRGLDLSDSYHRLIVYLKEALSASDAGDS